MSHGSLQTVKATQKALTPYLSHSKYKKSGFISDLTEWSYHPEPIFCHLGPGVTFSSIFCSCFNTKIAQAKRFSWLVRYRVGRAALQTVSPSSSPGSIAPPFPKS